MQDNKKMALVRLIVLGISIINSVLAHYGYNPIPASEDFIYQTISDVILLGTVAWSYYKNNDLTDEAVAGTAVTHKLKNKPLNPEEHVAFVEAKDKFIDTDIRD